MRWSDRDNNLYLMSFGDTRMGRLDAEPTWPKTSVAQGLDDANGPLEAAPRPVRRPEPAVVRRICRWAVRGRRVFCPQPPGRRGRAKPLNANKIEQELG
jgi:hypothetical protein